MKAMVWYGGGDLRVEPAAEPEPGEGQVVFDVALAGVCGSDLHAIRGHHGPRTPPLILGHELVGTVEGRSGRFVPFPLVSCGACEACRRGEENLCARRGLLGLDRPGAFAERVAVDEGALIAMPEGLDDRLSVLVEPLATPLSALRVEEVSAGDTVLVVGCGPIGLLAIHAARELGADVVAVEPLDARRALGEAFGARPVHASLDAVAGMEADLAVDAVGIEPTVGGAIAGVRAGGAVAVVGLGAAEARVPLGDMVRRGIQVRGHYAYTRADFEAAARMLAEAPVDVDWLTLVGLGGAPEAIHAMVADPAGTAKVIVEVGRG